MDRRLAEALIDRPKPDTQEPLSPRGFSHSILLQMAQIDAVRALDFTLKRVHGNKVGPPSPLPRPTTALQLLERERDRIVVDKVLAQLGLEM